MNFKTFWKNKQHYDLHIFVVMVVAVFLVFILDIVTIGIKYHNNNKNMFANTVLYSNSFTTTLSETTGSIQQCFVSSDDRQVFLFIKFDDMSKIATNAQTYQMRCTNIDDKFQSVGTPNEGIEGRIYMFGSTGYMGIYLYTTEKPFASALKQIQVANGNVIQRSRRKDDSTDISNYDRFPIYINPAGNNAQTISFLEDHTIGDEFDMRTIYERFVTSYEESAIRTELDDKIAAMNDSMGIAVEYNSRLKNYGLNVPPVNEYVTGDQFISTPVYKTNADGTICTDENGNQVLDYTYTKFEANSIIPGGVDFEWHDHSLKDANDGYINLLKVEMAGRSVEEYIADLNTVEGNGQMRDTETLAAEWTYTNGTVLDKMATDQLTQTVMADINAYVNEINNYLSAKSAYQYDLLPRLLLLERDLNNMSTIYTSTRWENEVTVTDENGNEVTETRLVDDNVMRVW